MAGVVRVSVVNAQGGVNVSFSLRRTHRTASLLSPLSLCVQSGGSRAPLRAFMSREADFYVRGKVGRSCPP